jgi:hypothetical protein
MIGAALGTLVIAAAIVAYMSETSMTLQANLMVLIVSIVVGVGIAEMSARPVTRDRQHAPNSGR